MMHLGTVELSCGPILLRRFRREDAEDMFHNWACDTGVTRFVTWKTHENQQATAELLESWIREYENTDYYNWAIEVEGEVIGNICVVSTILSISAMEVGYALSSKYWNQGIVSFCLKRVMDFLFDQVGVNRIQAKHVVENPASGRVMEKVGLLYEGKVRQGIFYKGKYADALYYGLVKEDRKQTST